MPERDPEPESVSPGGTVPVELNANEPVPPTAVTFWLYAVAIVALGRDVGFTTIAVGWVIVTLFVAVQLLESVTVTVYVPALRLARSYVVAASLQAKEYVGVPPLTVRSIEPLLSPKQVSLMCVSDTESAADGCVMATLLVAVQL